VSVAHFSIAKRETIEECGDGFEVDAGRIELIHSFQLTKLKFIDTEVEDCPEQRRSTLLPGERNPTGINQYSGRRKSRSIYGLLI
jgi:hypothetical protein